MAEQSPEQMQRWARVSACGQFRYTLGRRWDAAKPALLFVMLNPSTADADNDDPTIRRCIGFAKAEGFGAIEVVNLFAFRATKPADLRKAGYPVGPANDHAILDALSRCSAACLAWGANAAGLVRPKEVVSMLRYAGRPLRCLGLTGGGEPSHPLMLPSANRLAPYPF